MYQSQPKGYGIFLFFQVTLSFSKRTKTAMDSNNRAVNGEVAIDFKGDGIYNQRHAPHSPTLGHHAPWRSYNMENKMPEEQVRFYFISLFCYFFFLYFAIDLQFKKNVSNKFWKTLLVHSQILKFTFAISFRKVIVHQFSFKKVILCDNRSLISALS